MSPSIEISMKMKKRILCLNSEIFSPLYLDLFKNDNGNCFFPIWDFSDSCTIFSSKGREKCQAAFSTLFWHLDQISCELMIFFCFTMGPKKNCISIGKFWEGHKIWTLISNVKSWRWYFSSLLRKSELYTTCDFKK